MHALIGSKPKAEEGFRWTHNQDDTYFVFQAKFVPEIPAAETNTASDRP
jgi:hypothetical protein